MDALSIPTVTEGDLFAFHARHFPSAPHPVQFFTEGETEDDDGLGWYPDGVKRHLTDEQVAIFRHSELQRLLRERIIEREAGLGESETREISSNSVPTTHSGNAKKSKRKKWDRKKSKKKAVDPSGKGAALAQAKPQAMKRKWEEHIDDGDDNPQHFTHRRLARELDEQKFEATNLSYDD